LVELPEALVQVMCTYGVAVGGSDLAADGGRDSDLAYVAVAGDIAGRIASGEQAPGTRLRSERDLAEYYGRAYGTVRKATALLRERGLIVTVHGRGTFVTSEPPQESK
jgi:DNA-binding GntR family transcriptional regulator